MARCGDSMAGGAEALCLQFAARLAPLFDVEILTTCAADYRTWRNVFAAGDAVVAGVTVRRFTIDAPRTIATFDRLSRAIATDPARARREDEVRWANAQGPVSSSMIAYVREREAAYDAFVFFGYLYATTSAVLPLVAHKAVLVPFAHDEWMLALPMWDAIFGAPRAIVCVSGHERDLLRRRFRQPGSIAVVPAGVEAPAGRDAARFRARYGIEGPFLLYLGRVDRAKGADVLLDDFRRYRAATFDPVTLVIAGTQHARLSRVPGVAMLGTLDERTKWDALEACELLVMPSEFESLSLVLLEAWACARPALVNARSSVLVGQCRRAQAGVWYGSYEEFARGLEVLDPRVRRILGERGRRHVRATYSWERAIVAFAETITSTRAAARAR